MKQKLLKTLVLLCALIVGSATSWAETYTWTCANGQLSTSISSFTVSDVTWSFSPTWSVSSKKYVSWQGGSSNWYQIGSSKNVMTSLSIATSGISGTISKVEVKWSSCASNNASLAVSVGGSSFTTTNGTSSTTSIITSEYTGSGLGELALNFTCTTGIKIQQVVVTYAAATIDVTGVSLGETSLELEAGSNATLTANVAPANASNKNVTWNSDNTSVATVDKYGVVTAQAVGTATITVTTEDGSYTATCDVTVTAAPVATALLDFTTNDWGISVSPDKTIDATDFTSGGYTVTIEGSSDNGYYFDNDNIMIGKAGASLTLPAFPFNVKKIKVYGTDAASGSVKFNIFVDGTPVSTEVTSSKITQEFIINEENQAAGNRYIIKVTNAYNMRISKIEVFGYEPVTIGSAGFATLFTPAALDFSGVAGLTAYTAAKEGDVVRLTKVDNVPANTGVVLEGTAGTYSIPAIATSSTAKGELTGNATEATAWNAESGYTYYVLASTGSGVEFRPVDAGEIAAGKAFLKVAAGGTVHAFNVVFGDETGISEVVRDGEKESAIFDLSGRRVAKPAKGLYIVNGKKILVK